MKKAETNSQVYVSITGLRLKRPWHLMSFYALALPAMSQALAAKGNISAQTRTINGVHHTLSVWENEKAMRAYICSGAHLTAMKAFGKIATGKTFGFYTSAVPGWAEVHRLWLTRGVEYASA